ncbi:CoA-binding protein [Desulfuromonas sp. KJ2020]|uniref:CoA-binding protein n=1 Tax=Desulfuromonas sp. KJ2020 TaxID=2919173 RepID=UPI0020A74F04|nr:CoA-binding protein [Desulfuromonas sp. KJ2020]MCP3177924.1 CoA-binding protein [Desulfuromonas sp. KJ2020]
MSQNETDIRNILSTHKTIAMVGASSNPERASNHVLEYLLQAGYTVFPVNPKDEELFGQKVYRRLEDIPHPIDIVDVFRNPADAPAVAREAVEAGAKVLWLQEGVISEEAARIAAEGGLRVVMDRCMLKEHQRLKI